MTNDKNTIPLCFSPFIHITCSDPSGEEGVPSHMGRPQSVWFLSRFGHE